jgi:hypothetical protein
LMLLLNQFKSPIIKIADFCSGAIDFCSRCGRCHYHFDDRPDQ